MFYGHGVGDGDEMLIFHILHGDGVTVVRVFRLQRRQGNTAAADTGVSGSVDDIAADGADVELAPQHIGGDIPVCDVLAVHQFNDGDAQGL